VSIQELRSHRELAGMRVLQRGNRLSITPVEPREWEFITGLLQVQTPHPNGAETQRMRKGSAD
jgi:predicted RNA-binding protein with PUA-like domain